jgi:hypothetical protein
MQKQFQNLLWEDREQREYRAAKAKFFRNLLILAALIAAIFLISL